MAQKNESGDQEQMSMVESEEQDVIDEVIEPPLEPSFFDKTINEIQIADDWGYKSVWNQTIQESSLKVQIGIYIMALFILNVRFIFGGLVTILSVIPGIQYTLNLVFLTLLFFMQMIPHLPESIKNNPIKYVIFIAYCFVKLMILVVNGKLLEQQMLTKLYLLILAIYIYILHILSTDKFAGANSLLVRELILNMFIAVFIAVFIVVTTTMLPYYYYLTFMSIGFPYSIFLLLQLQLTQKREYLFWRDNYLVMSPVLIDSDLLCPCFMLYSCSKKKERFYKTSDEEEQRFMSLDATPIQRLPQVQEEHELDVADRQMKKDKGLIK